MKTAEQLLEYLAAYLLDDEDAALNEALRTLAASFEPIDVNALMEGLAGLNGPRVSAERFSLAQRQLRGALGLPMHVGAICKPNKLS